MARKNPGIFKVCDCATRKQATCKHSYYLAFRYQQGKHWRLSLDKVAGTHIEKIKEAKALAEDLRGQIRRGAYPPVVAPAAPETLATTASAITFTELGALWIERERMGRVAVWKTDRSCVAQLAAVALEASTLGDRPIGRITADDLEVAFRATEARVSRTTVTKYLQVVLQLQRWAVRKHYLERPWFDAADKEARPAKRSKVVKRTRRLEPAVLGPRGQVVQPSEEQRLRDAANPWMRRLIIAAVESGCRQGELLALQWRHVDLARGHLNLPAELTKTDEGRIVVVSARLRPVLEMMRIDPLTDKAHDPTHYVFGTSTGQRMGPPKKAWETCILRAHGVTPVWKDGKLTAESRAHLHAIDLHWHDLRREAASRWAEAGWTLTEIQEHLGHTNVSQTSTYLKSGVQRIEARMRKMDEQRGYLQSVAQSPESAPLPDCNDEPPAAANVVVN